VIPYVFRLQQIIRQWQRWVQVSKNERRLRSLELSFICSEQPVIELGFKELRKPSLWYIAETGEIIHAADLNNSKTPASPVSSRSAAHVIKEDSESEHIAMCSNKSGNDAESEQSQRARSAKEDIVDRPVVATEQSIAIDQAVVVQAKDYASPSQSETGYMLPDRWLSDDHVLLSLAKHDLIMAASLIHPHIMKDDSAAVLPSLQVLTNYEEEIIRIQAQSPVEQPPSPLGDWYLK